MATGAGDGPLLPDYGGRCVDAVVPALLDRGVRKDRPPPWLPAQAVEADQVVLLVLDGVGWLQLQERAHLAPTLAAMAGGPITTVAPSTTATALTSITTGAPPAAHGVVGYRVRAENGEVLNILRWTTPLGDARRTVGPEEFQPLEPFGGRKPPVVTRAEFADSGFTKAHLAGVRFYGWRTASTLVVRTAGLVAEGEPFVYAYYDGVDKVAHEFGFGPIYDAELRAADNLVADLLEAMPGGAALVVVSDHGQVDVGERVVPLHPHVWDLTEKLSGEGRFRWLHARPGAEQDLLEAARRHHADQAWVHTRDEVVAGGWLGGSPAPAVLRRLGDVVVAAREPVAFLDPADTGVIPLQCRHGSLTPEEMLVPLVAAQATARVGRAEPNGEESRP